MLLKSLVDLFICLLLHQQQRTNTKNQSKMQTTTTDKYMSYEAKLAKVKKVIAAVVSSPNNSTERAILWFNLHKLRETLANEINRVG